MERQNQILTALTLVFLALVALVVFDDKSSADADDLDLDAPASRDLFDYEDKDVTRIELEAKGVKTTLEKVDSTWKMVAPKEYTVAQRRAEELVERLNTLRIEERALDGELESFGLGESERASIKLYAGQKSFSILIGKDAPIGYRSYAQEEAGGKVHLLSSRVADLVQRTPDDFRSKDVWSFSSFAARRVRIEKGGQTVTLRKDDHGWWLGDEGPRADENTVSGWLSKASTLKVSSFEDEASPASLGLDPAQGSITVEDETKTWSLTLGEGDAAKVEGAQVRLGEGIAELIRFDDWTSKKLLPVPRYSLDAIELSLGGKSLSLKSQEGAWSDATGTAFSASDALLSAIEAVAADRSQGVEASAERWGSVTLGEGDKRSTVVFGGVTGEGRRVAREEVGGPSFTVAQADLDKIIALVP